MRLHPPDSDDRLIADRFRTLRILGSGGMGTVYQASDSATGEVVALKLLAYRDSTAVTRFAREAEILSQLKHPAIVGYVAHGSTMEGTFYLAMEFVEGQSLEEALANGPLTARAAAGLGRRVLEGLAYAHDRNILHRDIKPANLLLADGNPERAKILDFGIARRQFAEYRLTRTGNIVGTPLYVAPEQARGLSSIGPGVDIFAMGAVLFECVTGESLFMGPDLPSVFSQLCGPDGAALAERIARLPAPLDDLVARMVAKDPSVRPSSARDLATELGVLAQTLPDRAESGGGVRSPSRVSLSGQEQRSMAVLMLRLPENQAASARQSAWFRDSAATFPGELPAMAGARSLRLGDGSLAILFVGSGTPVDQATQAARAALQLACEFPAATVAISLGRSATSHDEPSGETLQVPRRLLREGKPGGVYLDIAVAGLLGTRFITRPEGEACFLLGEKGHADLPPQLLGKAIPCLGREREVASLLALYDQCVGDTMARIGVVIAPAGSGKSRLVHEFLTRLRNQGQAPTLLVGHGDPARSNASLALVAQVIRSFVGLSGSESEEVQRQYMTEKLPGRLSAGSAAVTVAFLGEIVGVHFPDDELPPLRAARQDARLMADQMMAAWVDWIEAEAQAQPVLVVLEDLHWADLPSVTYVDAAARVLENKPFMVLGLARPELEDRFPGLWRNRPLEQMSLIPLGQRACRQIVQTALRDASSEEVAWILEHAEGNPFYLEELVRAVASGGALGEVPGTVLGMVQARFDTVGEGGKRVLRAASIFGQSFHPEGVKYLVGDMSAEDVNRWLEILVDNEVLLARAGPARTEMAFRHALLHEAAYAMLWPSDATVGHSLAGEFLESTGVCDPVVLSEHFEKGDKNERALHWLGQAAKEANKANDIQGTLRHVERALRLGAAGDAAVNLHVIESEAYFWQGQYVQAEHAARKADVSSDALLGLRAKEALISAFGAQAKYEEIAQLETTLGERPSRPSLVSTWLRCRVDINAFLAVAGQNERRGESLVLLETERESSDSVLAGRRETTKAHLAKAEGRLADSVRAFQRAWEFYESIGDCRNGGEALGNMAFAFMELGQLETAETYARKLLGIAERRGLGHLMGGLSYMLSNICVYQGRLPEARSHGERAIAYAGEANDRYFKGITQVYLSIAEHQAGDYVRAEDYGRAALVTLENNPSLVPFVQALLARAMRGQGRLSDALVLARQAVSQLRSLGAVGDGELWIWLALAECLEATLDLASAKQVLGQAVLRISQIADTIDEPDWRTSFLTRISENHLVLQMAKRLGVAVP